MKKARYAGLLAVAALVFMAFAGTGSASATALCSQEPEEVGGDLICKAGTKVTGTHNWGATTNGTLIFYSGLGNVECTGGTMKGTIGATGLGRISQEFFTGCVSHEIFCEGKVNYEVTTEPMLSVAYNSRTDQSFTAGTTYLVVKVPCGSVCTYKAESVKAAYSNSGQSYTFTKQPLTTESSGWCASKIEETATYNIFDEEIIGGPHRPLYVAKE